MYETKSQRNKTDLTIIIPVYNSEDTIERCIDSIVGQSFSDFEIILIDDGSSDRSIQICESYAKRDERIKLFCAKHGGASAARNLGLRNARGRYIMFVDSDDFIRKSAVDNLMTLLNPNEYDLCISGFEYWEMENEKKEVIVGKNFSGNLIDFIQSSFVELIKNSIMYTQCGKLFKRDIIEKNNISFLEKYSICEDALFTLEYLKHCKKICVIDSAEYIYCLKEDYSLSRVHKENEYRANSQLYSEIVGIKDCVSMRPEIRNEIDKVFFSRYINFIFRVFWNTGWKKQYEEIKNIIDDEYFCDISKRIRLEKILYEILRWGINKKNYVFIYLICKTWTQVQYLKKIGSKWFHNG